MIKLMKEGTNKYILSDTAPSKYNELINSVLKGTYEISMQYRDPYSGSSSINFRRNEDGEWNWVNKNGRLMNAGTPNEKNSIGWSNSRVAKELRYIANHYPDTAVIITQSI